MTRATPSSVLLVLSLMGARCGTLYGYPESEPERSFDACHDGVDNDFDGSADCDDPDCLGLCDEQNAAECGDGFDNDGDGLVDADDPRCWRLLPPRAKRCGEHAGIDMIENFDLPAWAKVYSSWRRWGVSGRGFIVDGAPHQGTDRRDPLVVFTGNTTDADELSTNLGALVLQSPFAGNWQEFELSFSASVPAGSLLRAALVPVELAPSQDVPPARTDTARIALTLDAVHQPATVTLDFAGVPVVAGLPAQDPSCSGFPCSGELGSVKITLGRSGFEARLRSPNGENTVVRRSDAPSSFELSPSRLVFWGGSLGPDGALLDDVRMKVSPDLPCGFDAPQIPGSQCALGDSLGRFGQSVSVARAANGEYCALVLAGARGAGTDKGFDSPPLPEPTAVTAWRSVDGVAWTPTAIFEQGGSVVGAAIAASPTGFRAAVSYRDSGLVKLDFGEAASCDDWSEWSPGPTLFEDAEAPSYLMLRGRNFVLFTRPPREGKGRTLWRLAPDDPHAEPVHVATLPPGVEPPVSITRVGTSDLVLTYPSASAQGARGIGLFVAAGDLSSWEPIGVDLLLELPPSIDLFGSHGRLAYDDRGVASASLYFSEDAAFLLYAGRATRGFPASALEASELAVGTAELKPAGEPFEPDNAVPSASCGDGVCGPVEDCSSCEADCACSGPRILGDVLNSEEPWELISLHPTPEAIRYFDLDPPGLSWAGGEPTWSVLPLERAVTGDFELSFDAFVGYADQFLGACVLNVGLGTVPNLEGEPTSDRAGIFARVLTDIGWFYALPFVLTQEDGLGAKAALFKTTSTNIDRSFPTDRWGHVVLRREGTTIRTLMPAQEGCGFVEEEMRYAGPLGELPALLIGFGGDDLDGCPSLRDGLGSDGHGTIRNLELRLLE